MSNHRNNVTIEKLAERLLQCEGIKKFDKHNESAAWVIAHAFKDIEESAYKFSNHLLPQLLNSNTNINDIYELLLEIGEEFRHILYHINDMDFYHYLNLESAQKKKNK